MYSYITYILNALHLIRFFLLLFMSLYFQQVNILLFLCVTSSY